MKHVLDTTYRGHEICVCTDGQGFTADVREDDRDGEFMAGFCDLPTEESAIAIARSFIDTFKGES